MADDFTFHCSIFTSVKKKSNLFSSVQKKESLKCLCYFVKQMNLKKQLWDAALQAKHLARALEKAQLMWVWAGEKHQTTLLQECLKN